ncbi:MAG: hypothetical protein UR58_C0001G0589 [Candidatus Campbellbacteria bacterium GW2011_OD1_34_28]|jgi:hypothetical protein|nr:MAG: hypothetical protein UR58_C0001G0589 [Candidatus Campbellbacteria bacterium GW2011_OD1_34_28]
METNWKNINRGPKTDAQDSCVMFLNYQTKAGQNIFSTSNKIPIN